MLECKVRLLLTALCTLSDCLMCREKSTTAHCSASRSRSLLAWLYSWLFGVCRQSVNEPKPPHLLTGHGDCCGPVHPWPASTVQPQRGCSVSPRNPPGPGRHFRALFEGFGGQMSLPLCLKSFWGPCHSQRSVFSPSGLGSGCRSFVTQHLTHSHSHRLFRLILQAFLKATSVSWGLQLSSATWVRGFRGLP